MPWTRKRLEEVARTRLSGARQLLAVCSAGIGYDVVDMAACT